MYKPISNHLVQPSWYSLYNLLVWLVRPPKFVVWYCNNTTQCFLIVRPSNSTFFVTDMTYYVGYYWLLGTIFIDILASLCSQLNSAPLPEPNHPILIFNQCVCVLTLGLLFIFSLYSISPSCEIYKRIWKIHLK
jgi:hypothetical protein